MLMKKEVLIRGTKKSMWYEFCSIHIANSTWQFIINRNKPYNIENPYYFTDLCWVICLKIVKIWCEIKLTDEKTHDKTNWRMTKQIDADADASADANADIDGHMEH